ncbi:MAG: sigma-54-dependent Fis family transcriptional regulator [Bacteroidales bacterium]|nr:sigma-54-dependent Fis family transcriptional regulator [Bacteroidales bacterium]
MDLQDIKNKFDIIGNDHALAVAIETAVKFASTDLSVLILGESGTGKESIARIIHSFSPRRSGNFFVVNCGALAKDLVNSELFGHVKGSFTGSTETRKGYFEEANGGTLFLDEIAELPLESQALLLRVLQSGEYRKVGSNKIEHTNVRVVAATNTPLYEAVRRGKFREDLYFRLSAAQVRIPPLRDRKDDIYLLFRKFTTDFSDKYGMCKISLTHDAIALLGSYRWPGNIRQLKGFAESVTAMASREITPMVQKVELSGAQLQPYMPKENDLVPMVLEGAPHNDESISSEEKQAIYKAILDLKADVDELKMRLGAAKLPDAPVQPREEAEWQDSEEGEATRSEDLSVRHSEEELIRRALEKYKGNRKLAAEELGMSERTLYRKLPPEFKKK